ncbi:MAG: carboxymuconolactone decarboxylase family protein [Phycisphaerales bacterium]|nr:carboxymuconolactone decarboxylase family protein [Phycisphaerales bacterium]
MRVRVEQADLDAAFGAVEGSPALAASAELVRAGRRPVEMVQAMALRPELLSAFAAMGTAVHAGGLVDPSIKELVILEVSRLNACRFCVDSHVALARMMGLGEEPLELLDDPARLSEPQRAAVEFATAVVSDSNRVPDALFERLRRFFSDAEIVELTAAIGLIHMLNLFNNALQLTYNGEYEASREA